MATIHATLVRETEKAVLLDVQFYYSAKGGMKTAEMWCPKNCAEQLGDGLWNITWYKPTEEFIKKHTVRYGAKTYEPKLEFSSWEDVTRQQQQKDEDNRQAKQRACEQDPKYLIYNDRSQASKTALDNAVTDVNMAIIHFIADNANRLLPHPFFDLYCYDFQKLCSQAGVTVEGGDSTSIPQFEQALANSDFDFQSNFNQLKQYVNSKINTISNRKEREFASFIIEHLTQNSGVGSNDASFPFILQGGVETYSLLTTESALAQLKTDFLTPFVFFVSLLMMLDMQKKALDTYNRANGNFIDFLVYKAQYDPDSIRQFMPH